MSRQAMAMDDATMAGYVSAAAAVLGLPLPPDRAERVCVHLQRTAALAALLKDAPLAPHDELAEIYSPAAFPINNDGRKQL